MKQINGTVTLAFLEEDNQQRVIFRVVPLCTRDGFVFREKTIAFPDQGSLRIVPDKREQSTFKERMRTMGSLCAIQLASEGKELAKVRQNRNYDPGQGEANQFAIYSDVICEFAENGIFEVFAEGADVGGALSPLVLVRHGQVLYGPAPRDAAVDLATLRPFGNDSYLLHTVPLLDGSERTFYWNPELTVNWRQRRGSLRRGKGRPEEDEETAEAEPEASHAEPKPAPERPREQEPRPAPQPASAPTAAVQPTKPEREPRSLPLPAAVKPAPVTEPQRPLPRAERRRDAESDSPLPIGKRLAILDSSMTFEEQIERLDQPLSDAANRLGHGETRMGDPDQAAVRTAGTPLIHTGAKTVQPIHRGEAVHYVVEKQIRSAHRDHAEHETDYRHVDNPIENLNVALGKAWETPETREQAVQSLASNEAFMQAFMQHLHAQGREVKAVQAAQEQLEDIEAERLSLLMQLEKARSDTKRATEALYADMAHKKRDELTQLDVQLKQMREERDALHATLASLSQQAQTLSLEAAAQSGMQLITAGGDGVSLSPLIGVRRTAAEMVSSIRVAMNRQGFACNEDDATELLLHFALNDEFCICGDTASEAELCARTMLEALGLLCVSARTYADTQLHVASLLPANGLRTPTVEVCPMGRPAIGCYGHKTIRLVDARTPMRDEPPLPVVYAPAFHTGLREGKPAETVRPVSLESLTALREEAKPLWDQGEKWFGELDRQLSGQASTLYGMASQQMRVFVSAASGRLRGGFLAAADAAVLGWVVPAVCRRELNPELLRPAIEGLPALPVGAGHPVRRSRSRRGRTYGFH